MNIIVIVATAWLVIGWIGLVLLIVKTPRNRLTNPKRRTRRPHRGGRYYWGWGATGAGDDRQDGTGDDRGDWAGGGDWGGGSWGGHESSSGGWGSGDWGSGGSGGDGGGSGGGGDGGGGGSD